MKTWKLGMMDSVRLFALSGHKDRIILVTGRKPVGCDGPKPIVTGTAEICLRCDCNDGSFHPAKGPQHNYFVIQPIEIAGPRHDVEILHAHGRDRVQVELLSSMMAAPSESAIGISQDFALEEAFKDAIAKLSPPSQQEPSLVEIVSAGALYGGFSGFSRLFVRVEKTFPARGNLKIPGADLT
jgi:hypothetical protein